MHQNIFLTSQRFGFILPTKKEESTLIINTGPLLSISSITLTHMKTMNFSLWISVAGKGKKGHWVNVASPVASKLQGFFRDVLSMFNLNPSLES
jgi:hypothetical protein